MSYFLCDKYKAFFKKKSGLGTVFYDFDILSTHSIRLFERYVEYCLFQVRFCVESLQIIFCDFSCKSLME